MGSDTILERLMEIPRDAAHKELFKSLKGYEPDLNDPKTYDEKLQWLIVYHYGKNVARFADKLEVREYVKECGFSHMLTKIWGVYENAADISPESLPEKFVLKATHGSGPLFYSICRNRSEFDFFEARMKMAEALKLNYSKVALEYHYNYITPRIIAEEFIEDGTGELPTDYKIYCFNGTAKYVKVGADRADSLKMAYYDENWVKQDFVKPEYDIDREIPRPKNLEEMMYAASVLSAPFATARIDFYNVNGKIYFGEITLTPASALSRRDKPETEKYFGSLVDLSKWDPSMIPQPAGNGGHMEKAKRKVPKELINEAELIKEILHLIDRTVPVMHIQNYDLGLRRISDLMKWLADLSEFDREILEETAQTLKEMLVAQKNRDYCLLTDYLEFLRTIFSEKQAAISEKLGDECVYDRERFRRAYTLAKGSRQNAGLCDVLNNTALAQKILDDGEFSVEPSGTMDATLRRTLGDGEVYYHNNTDPYTEGEELAERGWYSEGIDEYAVYGLGLGYAPLALSKADPSIFVTVYETDARIIALAFAYGVMDELLSLPNVKIVHDPDGTKTRKAVERSVGGNGRGFKFVIHAPSLRCEKNEKLRLLLEDYLTQYNSILNQARLLESNFKLNTRSVGSFVDDLRPVFFGKEMILVAAGPSLDKNFELLRSQDARKDRILVAVGTTFNKLMNAGIRPDYVIITDANERVLKQIEGQQESGIPLILLSTAYYGFARDYRGPVYLAMQDGFGPAQEMASERGLSLFPVGGSVATFGVSLAIWAKVKKLITVGLDLSYPGNRVHASDTSEQELSEVGGLKKIKGIDGSEVFTGTAFDLYRRFIEDEIRKARRMGTQTEFVNATEGGAAIEGMRNEKLVNALGITFTAADITKPERDQMMRRACMLLSGDADNRTKSIALDTLYGLAFYDDMSLEECWQLYRNIDRAVFVNNSLSLSEGTLTELYRYIFNFIKSQISYEGKVRRPIGERNRDLVVFTISQFLTEGHAPTLRVLDYAYTWKTKFGKKVLIINDAMMHYYENDNLSGVVTFNYIPQLSEANTITHRGETFDFFQVPCLMPDIPVIQMLVDNIYDLNPLCVFNVGGSDIIADLCTDFVTTLSQPCAFQIPVAETKYLLLGRDPEPSDEARKALFSDGQELILTNFNYVSKPETKSYTRKEFGIPEDKFAVCVCGNRIESEMDDEFMSMLGETLARGKNICAVLIGPVNDPDRIRNIITNAALAVDSAVSEADIRSRLVMTGAVNEARSLIKHLDLCLNPKRAGGGRAAFEAMYYDIPCISLRIGDAYYAGGSLFGAGDYEEYKELILRYASDKAFYEERGRKAKERADVLEDMEGTHRKILERVLNDEE